MPVGGVTLTPVKNSIVVIMVLFESDWLQFAAVQKCANERRSTGVDSYSDCLKAWLAV